MQQEQTGTESLAQISIVVRACRQLEEGEREKKKAFYQNYIWHMCLAACLSVAHARSLSCTIQVCVGVCNSSSKGECAAVLWSHHSVGVRGASFGVLRQDRKHRH